MRLRFASPALALSLIFGWAAAAQADPAPAASATPPAAPIFYCPLPTPSAAAAPAPVKSSLRNARGRHAVCPSPERIAVRAHRRRRHEEGRINLASEEISQSQAFIYGYERALHGLNARAAEEAWGPRPPRPMGPPPPMMMAPPPLVPAAPPAAVAVTPLPPLEPDEHWRAPERREWAEAPPPAAAPPPPPVEARDRWREREEARDWAEAHRDAWRDEAERARLRHDQDVDRDWAEPDRDRGEGWRDRDRAAAWAGRGEDWAVRPAPPPPVIDHDSAYGDRSGYAYGFERRDFAREIRPWGEAAAPRCPPPRDVGCSAGAADPPPVDGQWRDGSYGPVYQVAGRDAYGYLVWPGKTP
jgi:hypothetical protein